MTNEILTLDDLKATNLPELQGFKQKQEELVKECTFIEITDNASYETAKKHRTALLKGRTSLESQDKLIASKLSNFRKDVKTIIDGLVAITLPHEEKQQAEVKRFEEIKENERLEKERIENLRIKTIKDKIESIETECYEVIQKMTFQSIIIDCDTVAKIYGVEFDFEEYDILFEQVEDRVQHALNNKISDLTDKENDRIEKENLKHQIFDTKIIRLKELGVNLVINADESTSSFYNENQIELFTPDYIFNIDAVGFESIITSIKTEIEAKKKMEREEKEEIEKEKVFEIRKKRLLEIGLHHSFEFDTLFVDKDSDFILLEEDVKNAGVVEFEEIFNDSKQAIIDFEKQKEKAELNRLEEKKQALITQKENDAENKARIKRLSSDKKNYNLILQGALCSFPKSFDLAENEEIKNFSIEASNKVTDLFNELLTKLENL